MVQLEVHHPDGQADIIVSLCSLALMLCLVIVTLGIKFFWFKQRLNFEPIPTATGSSDNGVVLTRSSRNSQEQIREPVLVQGIFRRRLDEDVIIDRPKILPPVRVRKSSNRPLSFVPPKRSETSTSTVNENANIPPPPPPLPSPASLPSLQHNGSTPTFEKIRPQQSPQEDPQSSPILSNGNGTKTYEQLKFGEEQSDALYAERRSTGYVRPDSEELVQEVEPLEREPPKIQPRSTLKETFKKNPARGDPITVEPLKDEDNDNDNGWKMGPRRLTGFFPPSPEEIHEDPTTIARPQHKVAFDLSSEDEDNDDGDENPSDHDSEKDIKNESSIPPPPPMSPPILLSTQLSDEPNSSDSWSAIQRHRNLAQEITERHEAMQNRKRENAESMSEFRNPLAAQQPKPRTMRDMRRNNARSDLLLDNDREATEA